MAEQMSMEQIRRSNKDAGFHFFDPQTIRFFRSRIGGTVHGDGYFITSEQPPYGPRRWTIRQAMPDGSIRSVGGFLRYSSRSEALKALRRRIRNEGGQR